MTSYLRNSGTVPLMPKLPMTPDMFQHNFRAFTSETSEWLWTFIVKRHKQLFLSANPKDPNFVPTLNFVLVFLDYFRAKLLFSVPENYVLHSNLLILSLHYTCMLSFSTWICLAMLSHLLLTNGCTVSFKTLMKNSVAYLPYLFLWRR